MLRARGVGQVPDMHSDNMDSLEGGRGGGRGAGAAAWSGSVNVSSAYGTVAGGSEAPQLAAMLRLVFVLTVAGGVLSLFAGHAGYAVIVLTLCLDGLVFSKFLCDWLLAKDTGTPEMRAVSDPIREGSAAFLKVMFSAVAKFAIVVIAVVFFSFHLRPESMHGGVNNLGSTILGLVAVASFVLGAGCSALAGYVSMWVASQSNIRVASAARRSYMEALII